MTWVHLVILIAILAIVAIMLRTFGAQYLPDWFVQIIWVVIAAVVVIFAIRFLLTLG